MEEFSHLHYINSNYLQKLIYTDEKSCLKCKTMKIKLGHNCSCKILSMDVFILQDGITYYLALSIIVFLLS